jgi:r-opsin
MSVILGPSHAAYTWAVHGGFGNQTVIDKVPSEMLHMVNAHWYQFAPINPLWHAILGFIIGVLGTISIIGNGMVIYIFSTTKSLRTPSNLLVINLAVSDFFMMMCMSPAMVRMIIYNRHVRSERNEIRTICDN